VFEFKHSESKTKILPLDDTRARGVPSFSVAIGGWEASREGAVEERTWHADVDEKDGAKSGTGSGRRLLWRPGGAAEGKGQGSPSRCHVEGGNGKRRGGPGAAGDSAGGTAWPCHTTGRTEERNRRLTGGPRPQCQVVALVDRRARAAKYQATRIQSGFKNISN
jgi:hypothetical protein